MSWFDSITAAIQDTHSNDPKNENLSSYMKESLATLAKYDRISHTMIQEIKQEEKQLLDQFEVETKDKSSGELLELDETPYHEGLKRLNLKRQRLSSIYEYQMKIVHNCYEIIDKKISAFDEALKPLAQQLPNILPSMTDDDAMVKPNKKKKAVTEKVTDDFDAILNSLSADPNEPKYCLCKRVSYGEMVACENADCRIEWFHFKCVGLKKAPSDPWYCPQCSSAFKQHSIQSPSQLDDGISSRTDNLDD